MRVVSYSRVSTLLQENQGQSLVNQERAFTQWLERTGHTRVRAYRESASAGTIEGRAEFTRMLSELPKLKVDVVIVDTLDRWTRNLREGLNIMEELRNHGIGLLPLDWHRDKPLDLESDKDWADVVDEFTAAEAERRRIRKRIRRAYEGRRERGATLTNKPPFGLVKQGDRLVPDRERAWIITEADKKFIAGRSLAEIGRFLKAADPRAPGTSSGVRMLFENQSFVVAGIRSLKTQESLAARVNELRTRYGRSVRNVHEFAGVFLCGKCADAGFIRRMAAVQWATTAKARPRSFLICAGERSKKNESAHPTTSFSVQSFRIEPLWKTLIGQLLSDDIWVEKWSRHSSDKSPRRKLERRLAQLDEEAAKLKARRDAAFDLLTSKKRALQSQAHKLLQETEADEAALAAQRATILGELATAKPVQRNPAELRQALQAFAKGYKRANVATRNRLNRALCAAIGSYPRIYRDGMPRHRKAPVRVSWPEFGFEFLDEREYTHQYPANRKSPAKRRKSTRIASRR